MAVVIEMQNTGDQGSRSEIAALIDHALCEAPGDWRVSIVGSRGSDDWELRVEVRAVSSKPILCPGARVSTNRMPFAPLS